MWCSLFPSKSLWMAPVFMCHARRERDTWRNNSQTTEFQKACISFYSVFNKYFQDGLNIFLPMLKKSSYYWICQGEISCNIYRVQQKYLVQGHNMGVIIYSFNLNISPKMSYGVLEYVTVVLQNYMLMIL